MRTWLEIDKKSLLHNLEQFLDLIGSEVKFMAVVKANAYGHGLKEVAQVINTLITNNQITNNSIWFGVDSIDEALILRREGIKAPILTLGYVPIDRLNDAIIHNVRLTVYNRETVEALVKNTMIHNSKFMIHIKVETGTSRQGIGENEILDFVKFVQQFSQIEIEGLSTHFANIEDINDHSYAQGQLDAFKRIVGILEVNGIDIPVKHTACSAATIAFPETHFNMVRVGISLYGLWSISPAPHPIPLPKWARGQKEIPLPDGERLGEGETTKISSPLVGGVSLPAQAGGGGKIDLHPVLSWKTIIAQIKKIPAGTAVSYGLTERVHRDSRIAILPVGYYDGYDRKLSSIGEVLVHDKRCKVIGRVCMNMMMVDVTNVPEARLEDEVVLLGAQGSERISAEELAQKTGTINYEVISHLNPFLPRLLK